MSKFAAIEAAPPAKLDVELLAIAQIKPGKNPRKHFDQTALEELAVSIRTRGVLEPILVRTRPGFMGTLHPFELIAGERRLRAAKLAGLETIPARVLELDDKGAAEVRVIENEQREDLSPIEKAEGYQDLIDKHGYTVEALAAKIGKTPGTIYGLLKLLKLPAKAREAVIDGHLPAATATLIGRIPNDKLRAKAAAKILEGEGDSEPLSYRLAADVIRRDYMRELKQAPFSQADCSLVPNAGACTSCPKRTGNNRAEYPDGRDDICTDPACFQAKLDAHHQRRVELLEAEGKDVITGKKALGIFQSEYGRSNEVGTRLPYNSPYVELSEPAHYSTRKSLKSVLGEDAPPMILAQDGAGQVRELVRKDAAEKIVAEKLKLPKELSSHHDSWRRQQAAHRKAQEQKAATDRVLMTEVEERARQIAAGIAGLGRGSMTQMMRLLVAKLVRIAWDDVARQIVKRRGLVKSAAGVSGCNRQPVLDLIDKLDVFELFGLLAELAVGSHGPDGPSKELLDFFGVSVKSAKAQASALREARQKALTSPERGQREAAKRRRLHPEQAAAAG